MTVKPSRESVIKTLTVTLIVLLLAAVPLGVTHRPSANAVSSPIQHIVVIDQENRSFDHVLGKLCAEVAAGSIVRPGSNAACDGATSGVLSDGTSVPLTSAPDSNPEVDHTVAGQRKVIDGGKMDGFSNVSGCRSTDPLPYGCLDQYDPLAGPCQTSTGSCIPNIAQLAETFTINDRTFEFRATPSWAGHMVLASATEDGFLGNNPRATSLSPSGSHPGWGCDSGMDTQWFNGTKSIFEPSCIPDQTGAGPYRASPVQYVPTIFDRLDGAGLSWRIYGATGSTTGGGQYGRSICPTFYECLSTQRSHLVSSRGFSTDAAAGTLPAVSWLMPPAATAQHPPSSMVKGDAWLGQMISSIQQGSAWGSTAIFLTWDDCGCFYDHVNPVDYGSNLGVRVPMIIVSPFARSGYTDSTPATFVSLLAFIEHTFGLAPLNDEDANAYDFANAFDYLQTPLKGVRLTQHVSIPTSEKRYIANHPQRDSDPT
jgi:phospholipase C